jgi:hypothetical protein
MNRETFIEKLTRVQQTVEHLPNSKPASPTNSPLTSTGREENTAPLANVPTREASGLSAVSSHRFRWPKVWASKATFASGSTYSELAIENLRAVT